MDDEMTRDGDDTRNNKDEAGQQQGLETRRAPV
jgi:hypothetical protein